MEDEAADGAVSVTAADVVEDVEETVVVVEDEAAEPHEVEPEVVLAEALVEARRSLSSSTDMPVSSSHAARRTCW